MPSNIFPNSLQRIVPSLGNLDPNADNASTSVQKINSNFERALVLGGTWLGAGLLWQNNKLVLANAPNQVVVGTESYTLSDEFQASGGQLRLNAVPISKLTGAISPSTIGLAAGTILIGGDQSLGRALTFDLDSFTVANDTFAIRNLPAGAVARSSINADRLNLPARAIPIGSITPGQGAETFTLSNQFSIVNGVLTVTSNTQVNYANFQTAAYLGANPRALVSSLNPATSQESLAWLDLNSTVEAVITRRLAAEQSAKAIYVDLDTGNDAFTNRGTSKFTPFRSIARAAIEVARSSYTSALPNANSTTSIYVSGGRYLLDNRPGSATASVNTTVALEGLLVTGLNYFNPASGGVILPRGCSIVGADVRKSTILPVYVPDVNTVGSTRSAMFRLTGGSYTSSLNLGDNPIILRSHQLLTGFEFVSAAELTLYYQKVQAAFAALDNYTGATLVADPTETELVATTTPGAVDLNGYPSINAVIGASPYLFNVSLRSRFGLCGIYLDGSKVTGFKSVVAAQFTVVSNQVDPSAYQPDTNDTLEGKNYKPTHRHFGFAADNDAYAQLVSCFVIGSATHYSTDRGAELSLTNSTSDFGGVSLFASGASPGALLQDTGFSGVRLLPPKIIESDVRELIVALLDPNAVTATSIGATQILNVAPIEFVNSSYLYVRVPNPILPGQYLTLQAPLVGTGVTHVIGTQVPATPSYFNVSNTATVLGVNSIYEYINCLNTYEYQSVWYNASSPPVGGLPAALATEIARRKSLMTGLSIFVQRVAERRTASERSYHLLVLVPPSARVPIINYLLQQPLFAALSHSYYINAVQVIDPTNLAGDTGCSSLTGNVYQLTLLRANRPDTQIGNQADIGDSPEDINLRPEYAQLLSNLDPRIFNAAGLIAASVDPGSVSYLSTIRLLQDLGYDTPTITTLLAPTAAGTLVQRYRCLPTLGTTVVNSSFAFNLVKPSLIRCSNHTWEWVGFRNYHTALPRLQSKQLSFGAQLAAIQTTTLGGQIYATGMDQDGNLYQGRNVLNLATNINQSIRFDGLQAQPSGASADNGNTFANISVIGTANISNAVTQNLRVGSIELQPSSQFAVLTSSGVQPLSESYTPGGVKANATAGTYGLVRKANSAELASFSGEGYITPQEIVNLVTKSNVNQTIDGVKTFTSSPQVPAATNGSDAVNLAQVAAQISAAIFAADEVTVTGNMIQFAGGLKVIFGYYTLVTPWPSLVPGSINQYVPFSAPGFTSFSSPPVLMTRSLRLGGACAVPDLTGFLYVVQDLYTRDSQGGSDLMWLAVGY